ncbi:MAG: ABC transporter ATP-binding protein [Actinobacteria bacterium]|nr:ABC transporter ATP-binding protein [Actinomycetota bacterium]
MFAGDDTRKGPLDRVVGAEKHGADIGDDGFAVFDVRERFFAGNALASNTTRVESDATKERKRHPAVSALIGGRSACGFEERGSLDFCDGEFTRFQHHTAVVAFEQPVEFAPCGAFDRIDHCVDGVEACCPIGLCRTRHCSGLLGGCLFFSLAATLEKPHTKIVGTGCPHILDVVIVLDAQGIAASRPNRPLFRDLSITVSTGDRIGVVGLNGCGKSTLLRILTGELAADTGEVRTGRNARIGVLSQHPVLPAGTVREAASIGVDTWRAEAALFRLGMGHMLDARTDQLSGGQTKRVALASLLCREWDALILDEPTNHLDLDAITYLEETLAAFGGGLLLVTHDRHVLDRVTTKVLEIDRGSAYLHEPRGANAGSGYAAYLAARIEREENAATAEQVRRNAARRELAWLRRGAPARSTKPKARVDAAKSLIAQRPDAPARRGDLGLDLGSSRLGSKGIELLDVTFAWPGATQPTVANCNLTLEPGDRIGIVGPNGAGKSTLLDLVADRIQPATGTVTRGSTVKIGYYDQLGRDLDPNQRVREAVIGDKGDPSVEDLNLMRSFWFDGDSQFAPIGTLSGGERRRLQLLLTLVEQPNVLLLDEPTNDLDLDTLRALEDHLETWPGIVIVVSHDRTFLDVVVDEILALNGDGSVRPVRGGVAGWLRERATTPSTTPGTPQLGADVPKSAPKPTTKPKVSPSTLKRQMGEAERAVNKAIADQQRLTDELAAAGSDHQRLAVLSEELGRVHDALSLAESTWLDLAAQAESAGLTFD